VLTIKRIIDRKRPYLNLDNIQIINEPLESYSFPSGHTTASFSTAYLLSLCLPHFSLLFFSLAVLVAVSRIYLGLHYPSDILMGILTALIFSKLVQEMFIQILT
jgi:undecaprenyl-diphosphatase